MKNPMENYRDNAEFKNLVDTIEMLISNAQFSSTEIREAAVLACMHWEGKNPKPINMALGAYRSSRWGYTELQRIKDDNENPRFTREEIKRMSPEQLRKHESDILSEASRGNIK